jgi:hypothetical protein
MKKTNDCQKDYEAQLQKLEDRLRKHAKVQGMTFRLIVK